MQKSNLDLLCFRGALHRNWKMKTALAASPILFSLTYLLGTHDWGLDFKAFPQQPPPVLIIPYVGLSLIPVAAAVVRYLWSSSLYTKPVAVIFGLCYFVHTMFSTVYGNVNNDAWSHSWMIDVALPPSYMDRFVHIPSDFTPSVNTSRWQDDLVIAGPHLSPGAICDRSFVRFMFHEILPNARLSKILDKSVKTYFFGAWVIVEGADHSRPPRVFTDFAGGNDKKLNKIVIPKMLVDSRNDYMSVDYSQLDVAAGLHNLAFDQPFYRSPSGAVVLNATVGEYYGPDKDFVMAQYSCMNEALWFKKITGSFMCFHKFMQAKHSYELKGTFDFPAIFGAPLKLPSGDPDDCTRPYVRAVFAKELHWTRNNHLC